ncbi:hypothetical protein [Oscillibacter sp.]|uniref:hypothetical protein n=1 Tax=Oscillibacter sp. TaxID=1945593 RepID=UPI0028A17BB6|nr:hypothetical protein [Oscillibacter sp.]
MSCNIDFVWLQQQLPEYQFLFSDLTIHGAVRFQAASLCTEEQVRSAAASGLQREQIYFSAPEKIAADLGRLFGTCRFIANSWDELQEIDRIARLHQREGTLEPVGLRVIPQRFDNGKRSGISEGMIPALAEKIRTLPAISVRGCFVQGKIAGLHGEALGRYFRECYEMAKRMTVILPCGMPYLCIESGAGAASQNSVEHPETVEAFLRQAKIVAAQNQTAFYAKLLIT